MCGTVLGFVCFNRQESKLVYSQTICIEVHLSAFSQVKHLPETLQEKANLVEKALQKKIDELTQQLADVTAPRYMQEAAEAFAFQKLCQHLQQRLDAQNIDMMILAGFCRNCLCKWYHVGAATFGLVLRVARLALLEAAQLEPVSSW